MKRQQRAEKIIENKVDYVIGGYENEISDGHREPGSMPGEQELIEEVYDELMQSGGWDELQRKDLRFLTTEGLKQIIAKYIKEAI